MTYRIGRGEQGVLIYEPYKSFLLPYWRFRTVRIARTSSENLWEKFLQFYEENDFVGMDMTRKFIQMGMTRSKRYANYQGGRKYVDGKEKGNVIAKSQGHEGRDEEEASRIFRDVWERGKSHEGYQRLKKEFQRVQKEWLQIEEDFIKPEEAENKPSPWREEQRTRITRSRSLKSETTYSGRGEERVKTEND
jgi:Domain of unknown function (DUF4385)